MARTWRTVVVDDSADVRAVICHVLSADPQFPVVAEAGDGAEGLRAVHDTTPDLVLLDLAMPVMDGLEFLDALDGEMPATTVVVLSGFAWRAVAGQPELARAAGYIQKNDLVSRLLPTLRVILTRCAA